MNKLQLHIWYSASYSKADLDILALFPVIPSMFQLTTEKLGTFRRKDSALLGASF